MAVGSAGKTAAPPHPRSPTTVHSSNRREHAVDAAFQPQIASEKVAGNFARRSKSSFHEVKHFNDIAQGQAKAGYASRKLPRARYCLP